jgi:hypothetical protein
LNRLIIVLDIALIAMVGYFTWFMATDYQTFQGRYHLPFVLWTIDAVDLFIHEGGHFFFGFMGRMIYFMGGSLMQIFLPSLAIYVFLKSSVRSLMGTLYWLGHNLINVSVYMGDAPYKRLPLLGGSGSIHDWNWIFNKAGMMRSAETVSGVVLVLGIIACCGAVGTAVYFLIRDTREVILSF